MRLSWDEISKIRFLSSHTLSALKQIYDTHAHNKNPYPFFRDVFRAFKTMHVTQIKYLRNKYPADIGYVEFESQCHFGISDLGIIDKHILARIEKEKEKERLSGGSSQAYVNLVNTFTAIVKDLMPVKQSVRGKILKNTIHGVNVWLTWI